MSRIFETIIEKIETNQISVMSFRQAFAGANMDDIHEFYETAHFENKTELIVKCANEVNFDLPFDDVTNDNVNIIPIKKKSTPKKKPIAKILKK